MRRPSISKQEAGAKASSEPTKGIKADAIDTTSIARRRNSKETAIKPEDLPAIIVKANEKDKPQVGPRRNSRLNLQNKLFREVSSSTLRGTTASSSRRNSLLLRQTSTVTKSGKDSELPSNLRREVSQLDRPMTTSNANGDQLAALHTAGSRLSAAPKPLNPRDLSGRLYVSRGSAKNSAW